MDSATKHKRKESELRSGKKPQRKARSHCIEKELRSQMRGLVQDRDTNGTSIRAVNYKRLPELHSV